MKIKSKDTYLLSSFYVFITIFVICSILIDETRHVQLLEELRKQISELQDKYAESLEQMEHEKSKYVELNNRYKLQERLIEDMERKWSGENESLLKQLKLKSTMHENLINDMNNMKTEGGSLDHSNTLLSKQLDITRSALKQSQEDFNNVNSVKLQLEVKLSQLEKTLQLTNERNSTLQENLKQTKAYVVESSQLQSNYLDDSDSNLLRFQNLQEKCNGLELQLR